MTDTTPPETFVLECERSVAADSPDHLHPYGTINDSSVNPRFNERLYRLFQGRMIRVLDLGCSGGGFVESVIRDGHSAIGLEGSDISQKAKRAAWGRIPQNLFTCDITRPFKVCVSGKRAGFDVITAWEVLEHLPEDRLARVFWNIRSHLTDGGVFIASTTPDSCVVDGIELHSVRKDKDWWESRLAISGLYRQPNILQYFSTQFVRGDFEVKNSFHLVCTKVRNTVPWTPTTSRWLDLKDSVRSLGERGRILLKSQPKIEVGILRRVGRIGWYYWNVGVGIVQGTQ